MPLQSSVTQSGQSALQGAGQAAAGMQRERMQETQILASRMENMLNRAHEASMQESSQAHERGMFEDKLTFDSQRLEDQRIHEKDILDTTEKNKRIWHDYLKEERYEDLRRALRINSDRETQAFKTNTILRYLNGPYNMLLKDSEAGAQQGTGTRPTDAQIAESVMSDFASPAFDAIVDYGQQGFQEEFVGSQIYEDSFTGLFADAIGSEGMPGDNQNWWVGLKGLGKAALGLVTESYWYGEGRGGVGALIQEGSMGMDALLKSIGLKDYDGLTGDQIGREAFNKYRGSLKMKFEQAAADAANERGLQGDIAREMTRLTMDHIMDMMPRQGELKQTHISRIEGYTKPDGTRVPGVLDQLQKVIKHYRTSDDTERAQALESAIQLIGSVGNYMSDNSNVNQLQEVLSAGERTTIDADGNQVVTALTDDDKRKLQAQLSFVRRLDDMGTVIKTALNGQYMSAEKYENQARALKDIYETSWSSQDIMMLARGAQGDLDSVLTTYRDEHPLITQDMMKKRGVDKLTDEQLRSFRRGLYGPKFNTPQEVDTAFDDWRVKAEKAMGGSDGNNLVAMPPVPYHLRSSIYGSKQVEMFFRVKIEEVMGQSYDPYAQQIEQLEAEGLVDNLDLDEEGNIVTN